MPEPTPKPWEDALRRLKEGNQRFIEERLRHPNKGSERRHQVAYEQHPFATIFACSDSRESPEIIFDRGLGGLFVVRTAGHALDRAALGSIEFSIEYLEVPLVVWLSAMDYRWLSRCQNPPHLGQFFGGQFPVHGLYVLLELFGFGGACNHTADRRFGCQPAKGQLEQAAASSRTENP